MKRKLFIHVGPHKTGTTLIQKVFKDNQSELLKNGIFYPRKYMHIFGHHKLKDIFKNKAFSQEDRDFFKELKTNVLISSEDFITFSKSDLEYIKSELDDFDIQVIYSWRRASLKMFSIWQEVVKHGGTDSFFDFYHSHIARPGQSYMLSADLQVNRFVDVFGKKNVSVIDYDRALAQNNLLEVFFGIVGCPYLDEYENKSTDKNSSNKSMGICNTEIIRSLNYIFKVKYGIEGQIVREKFFDFLDVLDCKVLASLEGKIKENVFSLSVGDYFIDNRAKNNMNKKYSDIIVNFNDEDYKGSVEVVKETWVLDDEVSGLLNCLSKQLREVL